VTPREYNDQCIATLKRAGMNNYVAVVGAGPSSPYIAPVRTLIAELSKACGVQKKDGEDLWVFCENAHKVNAGEYFRIIRESFGDTPYWDSRVYKYLVSAPFRSFVTLNYDCQLPSAFGEKFEPDHDDKFRVYPPRPGDSYFSAIEVASENQLLMAVHGFANPKDPDWEQRVILRLDDYNRHYTGINPPLFEWWQTLLASVPCIFIGTSLQEPGLARVFKNSPTRTLEAMEANNHIHLLPCTGQGTPPQYPTPGRSFSIVRQLYYDQIDKRYSGLIQVLEAFSPFRTIIPNPRTTAVAPLSATETLDLPDVPRS
jgi:hypothetical protein